MKGIIMHWEVLEQTVEKICGKNGWNLYNEATVLAQADKLIEEVSELREAAFAHAQDLTSYVDSSGNKVKDTEEELIDGIGDSLVVLKNLCVMLDLDMKFCFNSAIEVIAKRKGEMIDGKFVKEQ